MRSVKRKVLMVALGIGAVLGFAGGIASIKHHAHHRRAHFERHVARICAQAALDTDRGSGATEAAARGPAAPYGWYGSHHSCE